MQALIARFGMVGIANTFLGYTVIMFATYIGASPYAANALGYACGLVMSFGLNRRYTFSVSGKITSAEITRYFIAVAIAYGTNLAVLFIFRQYFGPRDPLLHIPEWQLTAQFSSF